MSLSPIRNPNRANFPSDAKRRAIILQSRLATVAPTLVDPPAPAPLATWVPRIALSKIDGPSLRAHFVEIGIIVPAAGPSIAIVQAGGSIARTEGMPCLTLVP